MDGSYKEKIIMKGIFQHIKELLLLAGLVAAIFIALSFRPQKSAPESSAQALEERLAQLGVPVKSVVVTQQTPLRLKIIILSSSAGEKLSQDDIWYHLVTVREVELAYQNLGMKIDSYQLIFVTPQGNELFHGETFLTSFFLSKRLTPVPLSTVKNSQAQQIFESNFDFQGLRLLALDAPSNYTDSDYSKALIMQLSTGKPAGDTDMAPINQLIESLLPQIRKINDRYGTGFVLVRVKIVDSANELLVDFMEDIDSERQHFWLAENVEGGWYPQPAVSGTGAPPSPTPAPLPSLIPSATGPRPTATAAYPSP
jgi:hypothetical protein